MSRYAPHPSRPLRRYPLALTACLTLTLSAAQALTTRNGPETLFPAPPARATGAALPTPVTPPVLRIGPLLELRRAEVFGDRSQGAGQPMARGAAFPSVPLPTGPMYRRDI